jgi:hypothetical protein
MPIVDPFEAQQDFEPAVIQDPFEPQIEDPFDETTLGGVLQSAGAGIAAGFTAPVRFAGAGLEIIEDLTGFDLPGQTLSDISINAQEFWQKRIGKSRAERLVGNAGEAIGTIASSAAALGAAGLVAGGGVGAGAATQAGLVKGAVGKGLLTTLAGGAGVEKTAEELREGEVPKLNAYGAGVVTAATEYLTEKIPLGILQKPGLSFIKRLVGGVISDVPGELLATATEISLTDKRILGKDRHLTTDQYIEILKDTAAVSVLSTIGLSAGSQVIDNTLIDGLNKIKPVPYSEPHISVEKEEVGVIPTKAREDAKSQYPEIQKQVNTVIPDELKVKDDTLDIPDTTPVPQPEGEKTAWEATQDRARAKSKDVRKTTLGKIWKSVVRGAIDVSGNLQAKLVALGPAGQQVVWRMNAIAGASTKGTNEFDIDSKPIYDGLDEKQKNGFDDYKAVLRNLEIRANKGAEFSLPEGHTEQSLIDHLASIPEHIREEYDKRNVFYKAAMDKVIQLSIDNGLRTEEDAARLRETGKEYLAREVLEYADPTVQRKNRDGKTVSVRDSGIKSLTEEGTEKHVETDTQLLMQQIYQRTYTRLFKNKASQEFLRLAETEPGVADLGIQVVKPGFKVKSDQMKVTAMVDGKPVDMVMPLELGQEWVTGDPLLPATLSSVLGWVSGKKILQSMATTLNPEFAITNIPRDLAHIWLTTEEYSSFAPVAAFQMSRDMVGAIKNFKEMSQIYIDNGGGMELLAHQGKLGLKGDSAISKGISALETTMGKAGQFSEMVTRLALMRRAMKNKNTPFQATQIARGYLDFSRGGSVVKALNSVIPFFNASVQGTRGIFRAAKKNPKVFGVKAFEIGAMAFGLTMANIHLWGDDYEDVPDFDKKNNWIVMTNSTFIDSNGEERRHYVKIPKDQGQRTFAMIFENMARKTLGLPVDHLSITEEVSEVLPIIPGELLPPAMEMVLGYSVNKDFWTKEDIWRGPDVLPQEEYNKYTPTPYVKFGEATGLSPVRTKYMVEQLFTRGNIWTSLAGYGSKQVFDEMTPEERAKQSEEMLEKYPGVRRLLKSTRPDLRREKEIKAEKVRLDTERIVNNRKFDALAERFFNKQTDRREVNEFIRRQETLPEKKRLQRRFRKLSKLQGVTNRRFWFQLLDLPPEQRAVNYWNEWVQKDEASRRELNIQSHKVPGFRSKRFDRTFNKMRRFGEQGGRR